MTHAGTIWQHACRCGTVHEYKRPVVGVDAFNEERRRREIAEDRADQLELDLQGRAYPRDPEPDTQDDPPVSDLEWVFEREREAQEWATLHAGESYRRPKGAVVYTVTGRTEYGSPMAVDVVRSSDGNIASMFPDDLEKKMVRVPGTASDYA